MRQNNERTMDPKTFDDYMEALKDLYIIEDMVAWNPNIRSKTSIRSTPTRHFVGTSIACRSLNVTPEDLLRDLNSFGLFFEVPIGVRMGYMWHPSICSNPKRKSSDGAVSSWELPLLKLHQQERVGAAFLRQIGLVVDDII